MKLPDEILDPHIFEYKIKPFLKVGSVFRIPVIFDDALDMEKKHKRFILMTSDYTRINIFLIVTSKKNKEKIIKQDIFIFIEEKKETVFEIPTAIDLNRAFPFTTNQLIAYYKSGKLNHLGYISDRLIEKIYTKLSDRKINSKMKRKFKKRILKNR